MILIISDTSVKNNVTTSVSHIHKEQEIIAKTIHYAMNVMSTKTGLFAIRYSINHVTQMQNITCIIIITDAKYIFDMSIHLYQLHSITIFNDLKGFFNKNPNNLISFWDCSSSEKWLPHLFVNKESKHFKINYHRSSAVRKNATLLFTNNKYTSKL